MNPLLHALADKPSSRQSFLYTGPATDLDSIHQRAGAPPGMLRPSDGPGQRRTSAGENGGVPRPGDGPKMVKLLVQILLYSISQLVLNNNNNVYTSSTIQRGNLNFL